MPFILVHDDIIDMQVDAIVNAANTELREGGGVCGAIFQAAGRDKLAAACAKLAPIKTGEAVVTTGFDLPAQYIIHTAGPVYRDGKQGEEVLLRAAYTNSLKRAVEHGCESVAFPLISSGIYGYPKKEALAVARQAILDFLAQQDLQVYLVLFDKEALALGESLVQDIDKLMYDFEPPLRMRPTRRASVAAKRQLLRSTPEYSSVADSVFEDRVSTALEDRLDTLDEPFTVTLFRLIDLKGKTDVEVYKKANLDRRLFSKIRSNLYYVPSKRTAVALALALELPLSEAKALLAKAGYALSPSQKFDVIIEYFFLQGEYDVFSINEVLFAYDQPLLGG